MEAATNEDYCSSLEFMLHSNDLCQLDPCCKPVMNQCKSNGACSSNLNFDCSSKSSCDDECCQEFVFKTLTYVYLLLLFFIIYLF
jgi:hypothetical protein